MKTKLQTITHCNCSWVVGFNGKDFGVMKKSGGNIDGTPWIAISNEELDKSPLVKDVYPCPKCGKMVKVKE
jgi:hypothetical protein